MSYLKYVFENDDVRSLTESNETAITSIVTEHLSEFMITNFQYVIENLDSFLNVDDLTESFNNIKLFVQSDMVSLMSSIAEVASIDESFDMVSDVMQENVSSVFTGVGYGGQKAMRLISSTYA